jgi:hypothetical protein
MTAPFDTFLKSLCDTDTAGDQMRKLRAAYGTSEQLVRFRKARGSRAVFAKIFGVADDETVEGDAPADGSGNDRHHVDRLADLVLQASDGSLTKPEILNWLLRTPRGNQLISRMKRKEQTMPDSIDAVIRDHGIVNVAKSIAEGGSSGGMSEHALTEAITDYAKRLYPTVSAASAFAKVFSGDTTEAVTFRRAIQALKNFPRAERGPAVAGAEPGAAYAALVAKGEALRKADPSLTKEMAFAKAFSDPANRELARAERAANRPA